MTLPALQRILNNTPGSATDIDLNFQTLEQYTNSEVITRDGSVAMQAPLAGPPATADNEYVTLSQIGGGVSPGVLLTGMVIEYGGDSAPSGWVLCNGAAYSTTDPGYAPLFAVIGYKFGDAGGGNFKVPDLRKKVTVGPDFGGTPAFDTIGKTGGTADTPIVSHTHPAVLSIQSDGYHQHTQYVRTNTGIRPQAGGSGDYYTSPPIFNLPEGTGYNGTHTHGGSSVTVNAPAGSVAGTDGNYQPYVVINKIMKL